MGLRSALAGVFGGGVKAELRLVEPFSASSTQFDLQASLTNKGEAAQVDRLVVNAGVTLTREVFEGPVQSKGSTSEETDNYVLAVQELGSLALAAGASQQFTASFTSEEIVAGFRRRVELADGVDELNPDRAAPSLLSKSLALVPGGASSSSLTFELLAFEGSEVIARSFIWDETLEIEVTESGLTAVTYS